MRGTDLYIEQGCYTEHLCLCGESVQSVLILIQSTLI